VVYDIGLVLVGCITLKFNISLAKGNEERNSFSYFRTVIDSATGKDNCGILNLTGGLGAGISFYGC
jgi:hypothetical protein